MQGLKWLYYIHLYLKNKITYKNSFEILIIVSWNLSVLDLNQKADLSFLCLTLFWLLNIIIFNQFLIQFFSQISKLSVHQRLNKFGRVQLKWLAKHKSGGRILVINLHFIKMSWFEIGFESETFQNILMISHLDGSWPWTSQD